MLLDGAKILLSEKFNSELINRKVGIVDYVHERTPYAKFGTNPPTDGFWENG